MLMLDAPRAHRIRPVNYAVRDPHPIPQAGGRVWE
jgi:hypothetical protein